MFRCRPFGKVLPFPGGVSLSTDLFQTLIFRQIGSGCDPATMALPACQLPQATLWAGELWGLGEGQFARQMDPPIFLEMVGGAERAGDRERWTASYLAGDLRGIRNFLGNGVLAESAGARTLGITTPGLPLLRQFGAKLGNSSVEQQHRAYGRGK